MNRCISHNRRSVVAALATAAVFCTIAYPARGENPIPDSTGQGVRHQIYVAVAVGAASPLRQLAARATLTVLLRISDHARDANFYGTVPATFADFAISERPPEKLVWEDRACHHERGLPTTTVFALNGLIAQQRDESIISAQPRHLGKTLPADEIVPQQAFMMGSDRTGKFLVQHMITRQSQIQIEVKLYAVDCMISVSR
jgi:hypothetical protein